jgi:hypothetical protein
MLQSTEYFNTSHSINSFEVAAYMNICNIFFQFALQYIVFADTRYLRQFLNFALYTVQSFENHPGIKNK